MNGKQYLLLVAVMAVMSFLGAMAATRIMAPTTALAQQQSELKIVEAQEFHLLDADGNLVGKIQSDERGPGLFFRSANGTLGIGIKEDGPTVTLLGGEDGNGLVIAVTDNTPFLSLNKGASAVSLNAAHNESVTTGLNITFDSTLRAGVGYLERIDQSAFFIKDKDGEKVWTAP